MRARLVAALLLGALLPGCSLFGGPAESISGPHVMVKVVTVGPLPVDGQILLTQNGRESVAANVTVPAGASVEKGVHVDPNATATLRLVYVTDDQGRASRGSVVWTVEPALCSGAHHVTFTVWTEEDIVSAQGTSTCVP
jgi:hypothetical protein